MQICTLSQPLSKRTRCLLNPELTELVWKKGVIVRGWVCGHLLRSWGTGGSAFPGWGSARTRKHRDSQGEVSAGVTTSCCHSQDDGGDDGEDDSDRDNIYHPPRAPSTESLETSSLTTDTAQDDTL